VSKVEILNDGVGTIEVKAVGRGGVLQVVKVHLASASPVNEVILAMVKEIEELREALELDASDLSDMTDTVRSLKMDVERQLDDVLTKLDERGKMMNQ
jgi:hypothetical protein